MTTLQNQIILLITITFLFAGERLPEEKYNGFKVTSGSIEKKIQFTNPGFELNERIIDGNSFIIPEIMNSGTMVEPGEPFLPTLNI